MINFPLGGKQQQLTCYLVEKYPCSSEVVFFNCFRGKLLAPVANLTGSTSTAGKVQSYLLFHLSYLLWLTNILHGLHMQS